MAEPAEPENSAAKNYLSGSGCGCGCLGGLIAFAGLIALLAIPAGFYAGESTMGLVIGGAALVSGALVAVLGVAMYVGALFME